MMTLAMFFIAIATVTQTTGNAATAQRTVADAIEHLAAWQENDHIGKELEGLRERLKKVPDEMVVPAFVSVIQVDARFQHQGAVRSVAFEILEDHHAARYEAGRALCVQALNEEPLCLRCAEMLSHVPESLHETVGGEMLHALRGETVGAQCRQRMIGLVGYFLRATARQAECVEVLTKILDDTKYDEYSRCLAANMLVQMGLTKQLLETDFDAHPERMHAILLGLAGGRASAPDGPLVSDSELRRRARNLLLASLKHPDVQVRRDAMEVFGALTSPDLRIERQTGGTTRRDQFRDALQMAAQNEQDEALRNRFTEVAAALSNLPGNSTSPPR